MLPIVPIFHTLMRRKLSVFLLILQIALATAIFCNLSFVAQEFERRYKRSSGIQDDVLFTLILRTIDTKINYPNALRDINSIQKIPGVESSSIFRWAPFSGNANSGLLRVHPEINVPGKTVAMVSVSTQALTTLGLKIIAGRNFQLEDMIAEKDVTNTTKQIIITQVLAKALFENERNAIGKTVFDGDTRFEIIGVSNDWLGIGLDPAEPAERTLFMPHYWEDDPEQRYLIRVKSNILRDTVIATAIQQLRQDYQNKILVYAEKMDELKQQISVADHKFSILLKTINVTLGLVIAFAISGQTLFSIHQRIKQIGLRRALGARQRDIVVLLITENIIICLLGLAFGILLALLANQMVVILGYPPLPPLYLIVTCFSLLVLCLVSTIIPAVNASKISPGVTTRTL